jgi:hypothetical protein
VQLFLAGDDGQDGGAAAGKNNEANMSRALSGEQPRVRMAQRRSRKQMAMQARKRSL